MRKTLTATMAGAVIALGLLGGAGVAQADPQPPDPTPILTASDDVKAHAKVIEDRAVEVIEERRAHEGP